MKIVKFAYMQCCIPFQTNRLKVYPDRFLPAPVTIRQDPQGLIKDV